MAALLGRLSIFEVSFALKFCIVRIDLDSLPFVLFWKNLACGAQRVLSDVASMGERMIVT
jgi:hypothetical protein